MRWVVLATVVAALGCGKRINPTWCQQPENQSNGECGNIADAKSTQSMSCTDDPYCASATPNTPWCNLSDGVCVQCTLSTQCPMEHPACTQNVCGACTQNSECIDTNYCTGGLCVRPEDSIIASPTGTGTQCNIATPCDLLTGVSAAILQGKILRLVPAGGNNKFSLTATLDLHGNIRITGEGTVIDGGAADPAIRISSGQVTFDTIAIQNARGAAVSCQKDSLAAKRLFVQTGKDNGADAAIKILPGCTFTLDESVVYMNGHGALDVASSESPYFVHNSVFANNSGAPAVVLNGPGRFEYNTVVDNKAESGTGGVTCAGAPSLDMNILADNSLVSMPPVAEPPPPPIDAAPPPPPQQVGCDEHSGHGFTGYQVDLRFAGGNNPFTKWHLTPLTLVSEGSPTSVVNIPNVDCSNPTDPVHDIDGLARPAHNRCDMGADECDTCYQTSNNGNN